MWKSTVVMTTVWVWQGASERATCSDGASCARVGSDASLLQMRASSPRKISSDPEVPPSGSLNNNADANLDMGQHWKKLAAHLEDSHGPMGHYYHGCKRIIEPYLPLSPSFESSLQQLMEGCENLARRAGADMKVMQDKYPPPPTYAWAGLESEDPHFYRHRWDSVGYCHRLAGEVNLTVAANLRPDELDDPDIFCTMVTQEVIPVTEEQPCLEFFHDVGLDFWAREQKEVPSYFELMTLPGSHVSFVSVCKLSESWDAMEEGTAPPDDLEAVCNARYEVVVDVVNRARVDPASTTEGAIQELCDGSGYPLDAYHVDRSGRRHTHSNRGGVAHAFNLIGHRKRSKDGTLAQTLTKRARKSNFEHFQTIIKASDSLDDSLVKKGPPPPPDLSEEHIAGNGPRDGSTLSEKAQHCCDKRAWTEEMEFEADLGIIGGSVGTVSAWGYKSKDGHDCIWKNGYMYTASASGFLANALDRSANGADNVKNLATAGTPDIGFSAGTGHFWDFEKIPGWSQTVSWSLAYGIGGEYANVYSDFKDDGSQGWIGYCWFFKAGFGGDLGEEAWVWTDYADKPDEEKYREYRIRNAFHHCAEEGSCFPANATVATPSGPKRMADLKVGDVVKVADSDGNIFFEDIYFFGHADHQVTSEYLKFQLRSSELMVSKDHFMIICPSQQKFCSWGSRKHAYAVDVAVGDTVWVMQQGAMQQELVMSIHQVHQQGMFNPYTLSGNIIVDDVLVSAHSSWVLDPWTPKSYTKFLPAVYQALFFPGRVLYHLVGPFAAMMLDVDNPQKQMAGWGPAFLLITLLLLMLVARLTFLLICPWAGAMLGEKRFKHLGKSQLLSS